MKLTFSLSNEDFVNYYLYASSKSERARKKRRNMRLFIPVAYGGFGLYLFFMYQNPYGLIAFGAVGILWFLLYPIYQKHRHRNHYVNHVNDNCKARVNIPIEFEMDEEFIYSRDAGSESKFKIAELAALTELNAHFLLKLKSEMTVIFPKKAIANREEFKAAFAKIGIPYLDDSAWIFR